MKSIFVKTGYHGFTLPELAVSAAVIGALGIAVLVAKNRGSYDNTLLRASTREVLRACELARNQATTLNQIHCIRFDGVGNRLVIEPKPADGTEGFDLNCGLTDIFFEISNSVDRNRTTAAGSRGHREAEEWSDRINFYPDGTVDGRSIRLLDRNGTEFILSIDSSGQRLASIRSLCD
jgi:Tfp pilus assembly protein FimT